MTTTTSDFQEITVECTWTSTQMALFGNETPGLTPPSKRILQSLILASPEVVTACTAAGYDPYNFRFSGEHRGMYLDLNTIALLGNETP
jgi:hypothetical protein